MAFALVNVAAAAVVALLCFACNKTDTLVVMMMALIIICITLFIFQRLPLVLPLEFVFLPDLFRAATATAAAAACR